MKILVTGGCGFIGSAVVRYLLAPPVATVINVDKLGYASSPRSLESALQHKNYFFYAVNICNQPKMAEIFANHQPDAVIHLAAESHVDRSIDGPKAFIDSNILGTYSLLEAARGYWSGLPPERRQAFRFLHVSTDEVYGSLDLKGRPFSEDSPYRPNSPYSATKAASDHLARAWGVTYGIPVIITHCSNNYGPWQFPEKLIPRMIANARDGKSLPVYGDGRNVRDWLHVDDHVWALWLTLTRGRPGETYSIGGGAEVANITLVEAICAHMDARFPARAPHRRLISFVPDRPGHDLRYAIDVSKIQSELGWAPEMNFRDGLSETIDWYLANEPWWRGIQQTAYDGRRLGLGKTAAGQGK